MPVSIQSDKLISTTQPNDKRKTMRGTHSLTVHYQLRKFQLKGNCYTYFINRGGDKLRILTNFGVTEIVMSSKIKKLM